MKISGYMVLCHVDDVVILWYDLLSFSGGSLKINSYEDIESFKVTTGNYHKILLLYRG